MLYGLKKRNSELMHSNEVKWQQSRQKMYLQKSKIIDVNEN